MFQVYVRWQHVFFFWEDSAGATACEIAGCSAEYLTFTISKTPAGWGTKKSQLQTGSI